MNNTYRVLTVAELAAHLSPELCDRIAGELFETAGGRELYRQWRDVCDSTWQQGMLIEADAVKALEELEALRVQH